MRVVPVEDSFDLHSFRPEDVASVLSEYLFAARRRGLREVRIIHGKGKGVRRAEVLRILSKRQDVESYFDAPAGRGGMGSTIVLLREA